MQKPKIKDYIFINIVFLIVSLGGVASKIAATKPTFSALFFLFYGLYLASMGVYCLLWQQVLKKIPLTTAFCNKAVTIIWGMFFGWLFFQEEITYNNLIGAAIVIAGMILVVTSDG